MQSKLILGLTTLVFSTILLYGYIFVYTSLTRYRTVSILLSVIAVVMILSVGYIVTTIKNNKTSNNHIHTMSEITEYFDNLERNIKSRSEVADIKQINTERHGGQIETRTYKIFISQSVTKEHKHLYQNIKQEFPELSRTEIGDKYITVESTYDATV